LKPLSEEKQADVSESNGKVTEMKSATENKDVEVKSPVMAKEGGKVKT